MRVLHTSDWHLGRTLEGRDRSDEQRALLGELAALLDRERVDLLLVAGDVFDSGNPPAWAEQLFYEALEEMSHGGRRAIVVLAGNHDSPERLVAANPLAARFGISLLGVPSDVLPSHDGDADGAGRVRRVACAPSFVELEIPGVPHRTAVAALPYPSEARLKEVLSVSLDEHVQQAAYSDRVAELLASLACRFRAGTVNLLASHLFVAGGLESDSERPIQIGGACAVHPTVFPANAAYVALGHLHRPQAVRAAPVPTRYSGSLMACGFAEASQAKSVVLVDVEPGKAASVEEAPLQSGRPLVRWDCQGGVAEALRWCEEGRDARAWIELTLHLEAPLAMSDVQALRKAREGIVHIRPLFPGLALDAAPAAKRPVDEMFREFFRRRKGAEADVETVKLFCEMVTDETSSPGPDGEVAA